MFLLGAEMMAAVKLSSELWYDQNEAEMASLSYT